MVAILQDSSEDRASLHYLFITLSHFNPYIPIQIMTMIMVQNGIQVWSTKSSDSHLQDIDTIFIASIFLKYQTINTLPCLYRDDMGCRLFYCIQRKK